MTKLPILGLALFLVGCSGSPLAGPETGYSSLEVRPSIATGPVATQTVVNAYTRSSIHHLVVRLSRLSGDSELPLVDANGQPVGRQVPAAELDRTLVFGRLRANTTYRLRAFAYKDADEGPDSLISTTDAGSYADVPVGHDDRAVPVTLKVTLIDVRFDGQASASGVVVQDGGYSTSGPETVE